MTRMNSLDKKASDDRVDNKVGEGLSARFVQAARKAIIVAREIPSILWNLEAQLRGAQVLPGAVFVGRPIMSVAPESNLSIGRNVRIVSSLRCNPLGIAQPCVLRTLGRQAELTLEDRVGLSGVVICAASKIFVGEGTIIGSGAMIIDNDFHAPVGAFDWGDADPAQAKPIKIGRGCFIGARAIILKGVTIGDRAIVGAAAVVTKSIPPGSIAVGNPARCISGASLDPVERQSAARKD